MLIFRHFWPTCHRTARFPWSPGRVVQEARSLSRQGWGILLSAACDVWWRAFWSPESWARKNTRNPSVWQCMATFRPVHQIWGGVLQIVDETNLFSNHHFRLHTSWAKSTSKILIPCWKRHFDFAPQFQTPPASLNSHPFWGNNKLVAQDTCSMTFHHSWNRTPMPNNNYEQLWITINNWNNYK